MLVIAQRKGPLWLFVFVALLFFALGALLIVKYSRTTTLECERDAASTRCTLIEGWRPFRKRTVFAAESLQNPRVEWRMTDDTEYYVRITTPGGHMDLGSFESDHAAGVLADGIAKFLSGTETGRFVFEGDRVVWLLVGLGLSFMLLAATAPLFVARDDLEIVDDGHVLLARRRRGKTLGRLPREDFQGLRIEPRDESEALLLVGESRSISLEGGFQGHGERVRAARRIEDFVREGGGPASA